MKENPGFVSSKEAEEELCKAVAENNVELIEALLKAGVDPECPRSEFLPKSLLGALIVSNTIPSVIRGAITPKPDRNLGNPLIIAACMNRRPDVVKLLLKYGAAVDQKILGYPSLLVCILDEQPEMVKVLLENGADPNGNYLTDMPYLMLAASVGNEDIVNMLLRHGAFISFPCLYQNFFKHRERCVTIVLEDLCDSMFKP